jgi:hypothetical protein
MSEANRGDASASIDIAARALAAGDQAKAVKFAKKAQGLYPSKEADAMLKQAESGASSSPGPSSSAAGTPSAARATAGTKRPATVRDPAFEPGRQ